MLPPLQKGQANAADLSTRQHREASRRSRNLLGLITWLHLGPLTPKVSVSGLDPTYVMTTTVSRVHTGWDMPIPPDLRTLQDLHPTSLTSLQLQTPQSTRLQDKENEHWHIFTDGSASRPPQEPASTWAVIVYKSTTAEPNADEVSFQDWYGGETEVDPLSPLWIGATRHNSRDAEASAITWALLYFIQTKSDAHLHLHCDPLSVLQSTQGLWHYRIDDPLLLRARATYMFVWTFMQDKLSLQHVKGHAGNYGNELADVVAGALRDGSLQGRIPSINLAKWYHGETPAIVWAWTQIDADIRTGQVMACDQGHLLWQHTDTPTPNLQWDSWRHGAANQVATIQIDISMVSYNVGSLKDVNRSTYMREQAEYLRLHVLGLQETRTTNEAVGDSNFIRIISVANDSGNGGCELWFSRVLPYAYHQGDPLYFERCKMHVVEASAELLIVSYKQRDFPMTFVVGHAPHSGHNTCKITQWWKRCEDILRRTALRTHIVIFIDANADVDHDPPHAGDLLHNHREKHRTGDQALGKLLRDFMLWAPSTFPTHHQGTTTTWVANDFTKDARNDFILLPLEWKDFDIKSYPLEQLDSGVSGMDHTAVGAHIRGWFQAALPVQHRFSFDRDKLTRASEDTWKSFFAHWPDIPWHLDTTSHAAILECHLQAQLTKFFPKDSSKGKRVSNLSEDTMSIYAERNKLKKVLNAHHRAWASLQLQQAFNCWTKTSSTTLPTVTPRTVCYILRICTIWSRHRSLTPTIKRQLRQDRARYIDQRMQDVAEQDAKKVLSLLKPMRLGRRSQQIGRRPIPLIHLEDGTAAPDLKSAQDRWRRHFGRMEGGTTTTTEKLLDKQSKLPQGQQVEVDKIPSIFELELHMMKSKTKKAMGPDRIPSELLKHAPARLAYHYWPLFAKSSLCRQESLQFKGGRLVAAYKQRGSTRECDSYRALLVSSSLAKAFHSVYRTRVMKFVHQGAGDLQFTSHRSPSVSMAAHIIRLHQQAMQRRGRSAATLFIDIKEAFYCVIRQHSLPATFEDEDVFRFLNRMSVCDMHIDQVARLLAEGPSLEALGCDEHLLNIVTEFHRGTWFHLASDVQGPLVHTEKGTRPGDGFADVLSSLTFAKWLIRLENHLAAEEILSVVPWNDENNLMTSPGPSLITKGIVAWADDVAVMTDADEPLKIVDKLSYLTEVLVQDLQDFGMTPNFGHGKTEAVLDLRGRSSHSVRRKIFNEDKGQIAINTTLTHVTSLRIVHKYRHLGGYITHGCKLQPELQHRIAQGRKTCLDYKQKIYGNKAIPLGHRLQVLKATALTSTLYNSGTWSRMNAKETQRMGPRSDFAL